MRKGWRGAWGVAVVVLLGGTIAVAGPRAGSRPSKGVEAAIHLTVDVTWGDSNLPALPPGTAPAEAVELDVGDGRVIDARALEPTAEAPRPSDAGTWRLGSGPAGRVRVRVETTAGSALVARGGGVATRFAVATLLDMPLRTAAGTPVPIQIERVAWDGLEVRLDPEGDARGIFAPGAAIPTELGFNVLLPEAAEVTIRYSAELRKARGGAPVWSFPVHREAITTNATSPPGSRFVLPAPRDEGSYVLEVRATWEPAGALEGSRLGRLLKWRRNPFPVTITRRVAFAVVAPGNPETPALARGGTVTDSLELARPRGYRAMASGRSPAPGGPAFPWEVPEAALVEAPRRDRLRGWIARVGPEVAALAPADGSGLAWTAVALRVEHPGRPHRLTIAVAEGQPANLGVALVAPGGPSGRPRLLLDAAATGPPPAEGSSPGAFSWPVWPDDADPVLVIVNRSDRQAARLASVELREEASEPTPAALGETHPEAPRPLALHLAGPSALDRFGGTVEDGPDDVWGLANNLAAYALQCGASTVVLADDLADRDRRSSLDGQADEDSEGPDRLGLILRVLARGGVTAMLEVDFDDTLPGLPAADSPEALARGLVRVDRDGKADGPAYQPLHPEVREAMIRLASECIRPRASHPNLIGLLVRLGPGATLPGGPAVGLDDATYPRFVKAAYQPDQVAKVPGLDPSAAGRFADRARFVAGPGRKDWLDWRAEQVGRLYAEMARGVAEAAPGAILAVATPGVDDGPAGDEARLADRSGHSPSQAWKAVGLDLKLWPDGPGGPIVLRGVGLSTDDLGHDLATDPELDRAVASRPGRGLWLGVNVPSAPAGSPLRLTARPIADGAAGDEPLGHALAVLDARFVVVSGQAVAGQEERIARFARVFRALPSPAGDPSPPSPRLDSGVAVRSWVARGQTFVAMANDTPYKIYLESVLHAPEGASVDDLGRRQRLVPAAAPGGGKSLVLELPPFGVAALRVGSAVARVEPIGPYLPSARDLDLQYERLSARLGKLAQGGPAAGPANPGFEDPARNPPVAEIRSRAAGSPPSSASPSGWSVEGAADNRVAIDAEKPRSGRASLRLEARETPASVASEAFLPPGRTAMTLRAWLRADAPDTPVRVYFEGESAGSPFRRHAEVAAGSEWSEIRLQAADLPTGGLDQVRLRFERSTPGPLWLDDVAVSGDGPSETARRAQMILTAALQAYREKRYADFARLAGSHWARKVEPDAEPALAEGTSAPIRTGSVPTDLPAGRRLR